MSQLVDPFATQGDGNLVGAGRVLVRALLGVAPRDLVPAVFALDDGDLRSVVAVLITAEHPAFRDSLADLTNATPTAESVQRIECLQNRVDRLEALVERLERIFNLRPA